MSAQVADAAKKNSHPAPPRGPVPSTALCYADRSLHSKSLIRSSLFFSSWTDICIYKDQVLCAEITPDKMALLVLCRHKQASHLLQHWQAWVRAKRSLRQRGAMVHRAHQGYTMRHAWRHWQWLASSKVLHIILWPLVTNVAHNSPPLLAYMQGSQVVAMCSITAVCLQPLPWVVCLVTPLHTLICCAFCTMTPLLALMCCFFCMMTPLHTLEEEEEGFYKFLPARYAVPFA
jgi:hypothetical protein